MNVLKKIAISICIAAAVLSTGCLPADRGTAHVFVGEPEVVEFGNNYRSFESCKITIEFAVKVGGEATSYKRHLTATEKGGEISLSFGDAECPLVDSDGKPLQGIFPSDLEGRFSAAIPNNSVIEDVGVPVYAVLVDEVTGVEYLTEKTRTSNGGLFGGATYDWSIEPILPECPRYFEAPEKNRKSML